MTSTARRALVAGALAITVLLSAPAAVSAVPATDGTRAPIPGAPAARTAPKPVAPPAGKTTFPLVAGDRGALVAGVQQRLVWLGYPVKVTRVMDRTTLAAVKKFRVKFFLGSTPTVTQKVFRKLDRLTSTKGVLPAACRTSGLVLCISKSEKSLRLVRAGTVLLTTDARFGGEGHPTREGVFHVFAKSRDHTSTLYRTWMPYAMFFSGGQAVHYSPYFHADGYYGASHGCVNLRTISIARSLFDRVPVGTRVVVYQ